MARVHVRRAVALAAAVFLLSTSAAAMASEDGASAPASAGSAAPAASTASSSDAPAAASSAKSEAKPEAPAKAEAKSEASSSAEPEPEPAAAVAEPAAATADAEDSAPSAVTGDDAASVPVTLPSGLNDGRAFPSVSNTPDGVGVLVGGSTDPGQGTPTNDTWIFENGAWLPICGTTVAGADAPCALPARSGGALGTAPGGVIMFGGHPGALFQPTGSPISDTWRFDGTTWTQVCADDACGPPDRSFAAIAGNSAMTLLFGGIADGFNASFEDTWVFDGTSWTQVCGISMGLPCGPSARFWSSMTWDGTHFVLFGGNEGDFANGATAMADTWIWTGTTWQLVCATGACGPAPRGGAAFPTLNSPNPALAGAFLAGGFNLAFNNTGSNTAYRDLWFWSAQSLTWRQLTSPWGPNLTWSGTDDPPAGMPLAFAGAATDDCRVVFYGTVLNDQGTGASNVSTLAGWDNGQGQPATCAEQTAQQGGSEVRAVLASYEQEGGLPLTGGSPWVQMSAGGLLALIGICFVLAYRRRVSTAAGT